MFSASAAFSGGGPPSTSTLATWPRRVDARVGPPRDGEVVVPAERASERLAQGALDRAEPGLRGPAGEVGTVVLDVEPEAHPSDPRTRGGVVLAACGGGGRSSPRRARRGRRPPARRRPLGVEDDDSAEPPRRQPGRAHPPRPEQDLHGRVADEPGHLHVHARREGLAEHDGLVRCARRKSFFDGTIFHRIVPGFVIQGGDPTGTGRAAPATPSVDTPPASTKIHGRRGRDGQDDRPGRRHGRQPVLRRHRRRASEGRPARLYALLGNVTGGMDVVEKIGKLGQLETELPTKRVVIRHALLHES